MMSDLHIIELPPQEMNLIFEVKVGAGRPHRVTVSPEDLRDFGAGGDAADLVRRSFEFLLEREPDSSILEEFDLKDISRYYPEYREEIRRG
ncbi:MAG: hypothetical protein PHT12_01415 [Patescibacteria group bacterium]|nr:hypothetical protein [Patescibacteria group bacterium]